MKTIMTNSRLRDIATAHDDLRPIPAVTPDEIVAMANEVLIRRKASGTVIEVVSDAAGRVPQEHDIVEIEWEPGRTKMAKYVRRTRTGTHVVKVERVDTRGRPLGDYGSERTIASTAVVRVVARAEAPAQPSSWARKGREP